MTRHASALRQDKVSDLENSPFSLQISAVSLCRLDLCSRATPLDGDMATDSSEATPLQTMAKEPAKMVLS